MLRNSSVAPVGSHEWRERQRASQEPDWRRVLPKKPEVSNKLPTPETMRQFWRDIGRQGGFQRSRNYARRNVRKGVQFWRRHGCNPHQVKARPAKATQEQRRHLLTYASLGGQSRLRNCSAERLKAIAAMGGRAKAEKAAKLKQAALGASAVAAKQPQE